MVIVNPETKGPVGDSHLGEVSTPFTFTPKSQQNNFRVHISKSGFIFQIVDVLFLHWEFSSFEKVLILLCKAQC